MDLSALTPAQRRRLVGAVLLASLLVLGVTHLLHGGSAHVVVPPLRAPQPAAKGVATRLVVDVAGAVRRPGLYRLERGTRVADAVAIAGGMTSKAERVAVNLAAPLADGEQIVVPVRGSASASGGAASSSSAPLDLNSASAEQLDTLPGVGPATAQKIIDYRQVHGPFHSLSELDAVPGIGAGRIAQLKGLVLQS